MKKKKCAFCTFLCLNHFAFSWLASQKDVKKRINGPPLKGKTKGLIFAPFHVSVFLRFSIEGPQSYQTKILTVVIQWVKKILVWNLLHKRRFRMTSPYLARAYGCFKFFLIIAQARPFKNKRGRAIHWYWGYCSAVEKLISFLNMHV